MTRALAILLLALTGCYASVRAGPTYAFSGERRGGTVEVALGIELHGRPFSFSPIDRRFGAFDGLAFKSSTVRGATHRGAIYELGGAVLLQLQGSRSSAEAPGSGTLLRADIAGGIGGVGGLGDKTNVGTVFRSLALVELERYWNYWAIRVGGGMLAESVVIDVVASGEQVHEGSYAPVGAVTVEFTNLVVRAFHAIMHH